MSSLKTSRVGGVIAGLISLAIIAAAIFVLLNRQALADQLKVWSYQPSAAIAAVAGRIDLTDHGKFIFYATTPEVETDTAFNQNCPRQEVGNPILGCYTADDRIYLYNVTNTQLDGMKEVTAAHEMLHAVWQRTSDAEKQHLSDLLDSVYQNINDKSLKDRMDYYQRTEPGEFHNELHSILATEVSTLNPELETYYKQFFIDRQVIVKLHDTYSAVYSQLTTKADQIYQQLNTLATTITSRSAAYTQSSRQLSADITEFNRKANNNEFSSQAEFNSQRSALVARSSQLERDRVAINSLISQYNDLYKQYQDIGSQIEVLNKSIDSYQTLDKGPSV